MRVGTVLTLYAFAMGEVIPTEVFTGAILGTMVHRPTHFFLRQRRPKQLTNFFLWGPWLWSGLASGLDTLSETSCCVVYIFSGSAPCQGGAFERHIPAGPIKKPFLTRDEVCLEIFPQGLQVKSLGQPKPGRPVGSRRCSKKPQSVKTGTLILHFSSCSAIDSPEFLHEAAPKFFPGAEYSLQGPSVSIFFSEFEELRSRAFPTCVKFGSKNASQGPGLSQGVPVPSGKGGGVSPPFLEFVIPRRGKEVKLFFRCLWEICHAEAVIRDGSLASNVERRDPEGNPVTDVDWVPNFSEKGSVLRSHGS